MTEAHGLCKCSVNVFNNRIDRHPTVGVTRAFLSTCHLQFVTLGGVLPSLVKKD